MVVELGLESESGSREDSKSIRPSMIFVVFLLPSVLDEESVDPKVLVQKEIYQIQK